MAAVVVVVAVVVFVVVFVVVVVVVVLVLVLVLVLFLLLVLVIALVIVLLVVVFSRLTRPFMDNMKFCTKHSGGRTSTTMTNLCIYPCGHLALRFSSYPGHPWTKTNRVAPSKLEIHFDDGPTSQRTVLGLWRRVWRKHHQTLPQRIHDIHQSSTTKYRNLSLWSLHPEELNVSDRMKACCIWNLCSFGCLRWKFVCP